MVTRAFDFELLPNGAIVLSVGDHCIQTTARHAYHELTTALLEEEGGDVTTDKLGGFVTMLERFLSGTDFRKLRAEHPELAGGTRCLVELRLREDGRVLWEVVAKST